MNIDTVWQKFFQERSKPLWDKYPGHYRALVVETNDPLNVGRIRFKCPDLHDFDTKDVDLPWAVPCTDLGGKRAGRWVSPVIGDWVWITFERGHPYGPIYMGFADPTRRKFYALPQIFSKTPLPVNDNGKLTTNLPDDFDEKYLPKDGRPMSHGWVDRYGHMDIHSSVGFYPKEHDKKPPPPDHDPIQGRDFEQQSKRPAINSPDKKYMARVTKYGMVFLMSDQGYHWNSENSSKLGEFTGDFALDEKFEQNRYKYVQKLLNNNVPDSKDENGDQRKILTLTRYGSKIELCDTGWAQFGPIPSQSRQDEYGTARTLSSEAKADFRWIKIRTKGGMGIQAYDKGFHPAEDKFIKRPILDESGPQSEQEDVYWGGVRDARWLRIWTRHGFKIVLDDRGSDARNADGSELPRGNGILLKGRRTPASKGVEDIGDPRGFMWEFNENDKANHSTWASPMGQSIELNDRYQYLMMAVSMGKNWVPKYQGLQEHEFIRKPMVLNNPETSAYHLKLDHDNEYLRLKTRGGRGPSPDNPVNQPGVASDEIQQGFEARDGANGDGPWTEIVDCQHRGMWFSKQEQIGIWRGKTGQQMYQWFDDRQRKIVIYNNEENGTIEIYSNKNVSVISNQDVSIRADRHVFIKAGESIRMQAGGAKFSIAKNIATNVAINATRVNAFITGAFPGPGAGRPHPGGAVVERLAKPDLPQMREPTDRGRTYNGPFEECPQSEVEHDISQ